MSEYEQQREYERDAEKSAENGRIIGASVGAFYAQLIANGLETRYALVLTKMWCYHLFESVMPTPRIELNGPESDEMFERIMRGVRESARDGVSAALSDTSDGEPEDPEDEDGEEWRRGGR